MADSAHANSGSKSARFPPIASLEKVSEDELWDLLHADAVAEAERGQRVELKRYLDGVPGMRQSGVGLHAAITAALENGRRLGLRREDQLGEMRRQHPGMAARIDEIELVQELMGDSSEEDESPAAARELPCAYGPPSLHGAARYELRELLGIGTRGYVYKAQDRLLSQSGKPSWVAIKVIPDWTGMRLRDVLNEARRAKHIDHEAIARVIDAGEHDDECFIVYEFIDGLTLADWRESQTGMSPRAMVATVVPVIEAMAEAHAEGLAHLDIHPRNVMIDRKSRARLIDFGLGHMAHEAWRPTSRPLGSLGFVAPEIYRREQRPSLIRADVYGFGGLLYWLVTGRIPNGESVEETEFRLSQGSSPIASGLVSGRVDATLFAIIERSLSPKPQDRYDSARGLGTDLRAWLANRPIEWMSPGPTKRLSLLARRSPGRLALAAILLVMVVLFTAALTAQRVNHAADLRVAAADQQRELAEIEAVRLQEDAALGEKLKQFSGAIQAAAMADNTRRTTGRDWIVLLTLVHSLAEAGLEMDSEVIGTLNRERVRIASERAIEAEELHGEDDIQARLWRAAMVSWLVDSKRYGEALAELRRTLPRWEGRAGEESLLANLRLLEAALTVMTESRDGGVAAELLRAENASSLSTTVQEHLRMLAGSRGQ